MKFSSELVQEFAGVDRLLEELAGHGRDEEGGVTRLLYSRSWSHAQQFLAERIKAAGLAVRFDRAGSLYGRLSGSDSSLPVVLTGSHVDTVRSGGKYDGAYGIAAGILALEYLKKNHGQPLRTIEVVSLCEEEGSRFPLAFWGSGNICGLYDLDDGVKAVDAEGCTLLQAMQAAGFGGEGFEPCRREDIACFIELHIEQGMVLERLRQQIGVVEAIAGQRRYQVTLKGMSNHAGTTPMHMRADALAGAAAMLHEMECMAKGEGDPLVATSGRLEVKPNMGNVVPGEAVFTLDIRHAEEEKLEAFCGQLLSRFEQIAAARNLSFGLVNMLRTKPAAMDSGLTGLLEQLCLGFGVSHRRMVSGAGHDAQVFASLCRTAMIFVPSREGISHSPEEYTKPEHLALGAALLAACLYELAYNRSEVI